MIFALLASIWQLLATFNLYNKGIIPPPSQDFNAVINLWKQGTLWSDFVASMGRYVPGFMIGGVAGIISGIITGTIPECGDAINPLFHYLRSIPSVALVPFMLVLFGLGNAGKIILVAWACMFPVWLNTQTGIRRVPREYIQASQVFGIKGLRRVIQVWLPCALPHILSGLRIAVSTGLFALAAVEMFAGSSGIGFRIMYSYQLFQTNAMVGMTLFLGFIALIAELLLSVISSYILRWDNNV